jgi:hypothetical protein
VGVLPERHLQKGAENQEIFAKRVTNRRSRCLHREGYFFLILSGTLKIEYTVLQVRNPRE